ncbi:MAG: hypothetical protein L6Q54_02000 [Leptospiraceae bacterium]|nr:hypothetical protein [Leptospiraceae bacterium]MCK6380012.1 hypothetical protein [Leptospiraceae bacterium]NUM40316.1 hypothetical protein [Leptospiraceae bacterium]
MKYLLILIVFLTSCKTFVSVNRLPDDSIRICFWNVKNLSEGGLKRKTKGAYILDFAKKCDIIAFMEIRSANINMAEEISKEFENIGEEYTCIEGNPKGKVDTKRKEKYLACANIKVTELDKSEFLDEEKDFVRAPTYFLFRFKEMKFLLAPFHSTPGDSEELTKFQKVIDFAYQKYSDRRAFFGGDFNTGTNYQTENFVGNLNYFKILKQLIEEPTTFANQKHDLIFTDRATAIKCKGKVWRLDKLFTDLEERKDFEKISDHFPVSIDCKF